MASGRTPRPAFTGAPHQYHRAARRMGAGWPIAQVARVLGCDPMDLHLLLREEPFAELFRAYCDLRELAPEERLRRLREVALLVLEEALEEKDPRVAWRTAARLREGVMEEAAGRREEPPQPPRYDDAMLQCDLALIRECGQGRRSLPADILEEIEAEPEMSPEKKAHLRRLYMAMPEGP
jgi:hypothetical protein